jgi:hypothetical protein
MPHNNSDAPSIDECFETSLVKKRTPNANPKAEIKASISPKVMIGSDEVFTSLSIMFTSLKTAIKNPVIAIMTPAI